MRKLKERRYNMKKSHWKLKLGITIIVGVAIFNAGAKHNETTRKAKVALRVESQIASAKYEREQLIKKRKAFINGLQELTLDGALAYAKKKVLGEL